MSDYTKRNNLGHEKNKNKTKANEMQGRNQQWRVRFDKKKTELMRKKSIIRKKPEKKIIRKNINIESQDRDAFQKSE